MWATACRCPRAVGSVGNSVRVVHQNPQAVICTVFTLLGLPEIMTLAGPGQLLISLRLDLSLKNASLSLVCSSYPWGEPLSERLSVSAAE